MESNPDIEVWQLWREQAGEEQRMEPSEIRSKAEQLDRKNRGSRVFTALLFILIVIREAWQVWTGQEMLERTGDLLTIAALVYVAYRFHKHLRAAPPFALGRTNSLEFYRSELVRQRDLSKDSWGYLLPFVPGVALSLFGGGFEDRSTGQMVAIAVLGVTLFLGIAWWNAHTARKLQREVDALDAS